MVIEVALDKEDLSARELAYQYLVRYEKEIKSKALQYNFVSSKFQTFCNKNSIKCKNTLAQKELNKISRLDNYFFFDARKNNVSKNDIAHHLLRHIRNSIAHALVSKKNKYYLLKDYNQQQNNTMIGKIKVDLFCSFIDKLINSSN